MIICNCGPGDHERDNVHCRGNDPKPLKPLKWHISTSGPYRNGLWIAHGCIGATDGFGGMIITEAGNLPSDMQFHAEDDARKEAQRRAGLRLLATALEMLAGD